MNTVLADELIDIVEKRTASIRKYIGLDYINEMISEEKQKLYDKKILPYDYQLINIAQQIKNEVYQTKTEYKKVSEVFQDKYIMHFYYQTLSNMEKSKKQNHLKFQENPLSK